MHKKSLSWTLKILYFLSITSVIFVFIFISNRFVAQKKTIQQDIISLKRQLKELPMETLGHQPWTLGYRYRSNSQNELEIKMWFIEPSKMDTIVFMPSVYTKNRLDNFSFGFPVRFTIEGMTTIGTKEVLVDHSNQDYPIDSFYPQIFSVKSQTRFKGLVITIHKLALNDSTWDTKFVFAMREIMVFNGEWNIALGARVRAPYRDNYSYIWSHKNLVDGFSFFTPLKFRNFKANQFNFQHQHPTADFILDLGVEQDVDEFRLWPIIPELQHYFPSVIGKGFPQEFTLEAFTGGNLLNAEVIYSSPTPFPRPGMNPYMCRITPTKARTFRIKAKKPMIDHRLGGEAIFIAEIELAHKGVVVSRRCKIWLEGGDQRHLGNLTDGLSNQGEILSLRSWVFNLREKNNLKIALKKNENELDFLEEIERERLFTIVIFAIIVLILVFLFHHLLRLSSDKKHFKMREQIGSDLHDHIGANLSSISHSIELLCENPNLSQQEVNILNRAITTARSTAQQTRHMARLLEHRELKGDVFLQIKSLVSQVLPVHQVDYNMDDQGCLEECELEFRWHFISFIKEVLHNIAKHSNSNKVEINIKRTGRQLNMMISDNGCGFDTTHTVPHHLKKRAKMMKADLEFSSEPNVGTSVYLSFKVS